MNIQIRTKSISVHRAHVASNVHKKDMYSITMSTNELEYLRQILWEVSSKQACSTVKNVFAGALATTINKAFVLNGD